MANRSTIGVVSVTYNASAIIDGFLTSLLKQTYSDFVLYITDNASSDRTLEQIARYNDPRVRVFRSQQNLGWAEGVNHGIRAALADSCPLIVLMNNDTEFDASLLVQLASGLDEYQCDMIVPKILFFDQQDMIWSAGGTFRRWRGYAPAHYGVFEIDRGQFDLPQRVEHGPACCLLIRRKVFEQIGLLDERFFLGLDDADFCYRAMRAGLKLFYLPSAKMFHKASSSTGGVGSDLSSRYTTRGQVIYILKHFGVLGRAIYLPAYQMLLLVRLITRKINLLRFLLQERAFFEGLRVWTSTEMTKRRLMSRRTSRVSQRAKTLDERWTLDEQ
jgi:GT2 family glycosyltransferase